jgi:hypothetical protein
MPTNPVGACGAPAANGARIDRLVSGTPANRRITSDPSLAGVRVIMLTTFELDEYAGLFAAGVAAAGCRVTAAKGRVFGNRLASTSAFAPVHLRGRGDPLCRDPGIASITASTTSSPDRPGECR